MKRSDMPLARLYRKWCSIPELLVWNQDVKPPTVLEQRGGDF